MTLFRLDICHKGDYGRYFVALGLTLLDAYFVLSWPKGMPRLWELRLGHPRLLNAWIWGPGA